MTTLKALDDRRRTLARIAHHLNTAREHLMFARQLADQSGLVLDLPREQSFGETLDTLAALYHSTGEPI